MYEDNKLSVFPGVFVVDEFHNIISGTSILHTAVRGMVKQQQDAGVLVMKWLLLSGSAGRPAALTR